MDPNENLREQREIAERIVRCHEDETNDALALAELVLALDGWLQRGGFMPAEWTPFAAVTPRAS